MQLHRLDDRRQLQRLEWMQLAVERDPLADDPFRACRLVHRYFLHVAFDEQQQVLQGIAGPGPSPPPSGSASRRTAGITAWPAPSRSPCRTPRPRRRAGRRGCASAAADPQTAGGAPPARPPPRRPQSRRSPDTSPATAAARRPRSASGSQNTAQDASPDARDASSEDEPRSDAGRSRPAGRRLAQHPAGDVTRARVASPAPAPPSR